jgi:ABC-type hemin transport system substrate-binding protein
MPKAKDLVISLAKQLNHLGQSNNLESVDSVMHSPAYQNKKVSHFAAAIPPAW